MSLALDATLLMAGFLGGFFVGALAIVSFQRSTRADYEQTMQRLADGAPPPPPPPRRATPPRPTTKRQGGGSSATTSDEMSQF